PRITPPPFATASSMCTGTTSVSFPLQTARWSSSTDAISSGVVRGRIRSASSSMGPILTSVAAEPLPAPVLPAEVSQVLQHPRRLETKCPRQRVQRAGAAGGEIVDPERRERRPRQKPLTQTKEGAQRPWADFDQHAPDVRRRHHQLDDFPQGQDLRSADFIRPADQAVPVEGPDRR